MIELQREGTEKTVPPLQRHHSEGLALSGQKLQVRRLGALGAEISGFGRLDQLDDADLAGLRSVWLEHLVLFFRDANLGPAQFLGFAGRLGTPTEYPFLKSLDGFPFITAVIKRAHETVNFGGIWHSDTSYLPEPPMATLLIARTIPPFGGDTLFANGYLAYESLSAGMKRILDSAIAVNSSALADASKTREDRLRENAGPDAARIYLAEHPVVRTHPETGRKALYVNPAHTLRLKDMSDEESSPILNFLFAHQVRPELTCRFQWSEGALALWDNRCALHNPINDYQGHERVMHRVTLEGDKPS
jgi:taurine dioxygenase